MLLAEAPPRCAALAEFLALAHLSSEFRVYYSQGTGKPAGIALQAAPTLAHLKVGCGLVEGVFWISQVNEVKAHAEMAVASQRSLCGWVRDPIMYCYGSKEQCGSEQRHEVLCRQRWRSDPHLMKHVGDERPR